LSLDEAQAALDALAAHKSAITVREAVELQKLKKALQAKRRAVVVGPSMQHQYNGISIQVTWCGTDCQIVKSCAVPDTGKIIHGPISMVPSCSHNS